MDGVADVVIEEQTEYLRSRGWRDYQERVGNDLETRWSNPDHPGGHTLDEAWQLATGEGTGPVIPASYCADRDVVLGGEGTPS